MIVALLVAASLAQAALPATLDHSVAHVVARSRELGAILFAELLPLRVGGSSLKPIDPKSGFIADLKTRTFQSAAEAPAQTERTAWMPTLAVAKDGRRW